MAVIKKRRIKLLEFLTPEKFAKRFSGRNPAHHFIRLYDFDLDQVSHRQENFEDLRELTTDEHSK